MITTKLHTRTVDVGHSIVAAGDDSLTQFELDAVNGGAARSSIVNGYAAEFYAGTRIENVSDVSFVFHKVV